MKIRLYGRTGVETLSFAIKTQTDMYPRNVAEEILAYLGAIDRDIYFSPKTYIYYASEETINKWEIFFSNFKTLEERTAFYRLCRLDAIKQSVGF